MMQTSFATDLGPRENLEDTGGAFSLRADGPTPAEMHDLMLLDGVGGNSAGEVASATGKESLSRSLAPLIALPANSLTPVFVSKSIVRAMENANEEILRRAAADAQLAGMSTTAVCAVIIANTMITGSVGDSRCYVVRGSSIRRMTRDDTALQPLIDLGLISHQEAARDPRAHVITRWLGQREGFGVSTSQVTLQAGDVVILCSDGLTDVVTDEQIAQQVAVHRNAQELFSRLAQRLVTQALRQGTTDNVTVLCGLHGNMNRPTTSALDTTLTGTYTLHLMQVLERQRKETHDACVA